MFSSTMGLMGSGELPVAVRRIAVLNLQNVTRSFLGELRAGFPGAPGRRFDRLNAGHCSLQPSSVRNQKYIGGAALGWKAEIEVAMTAPLEHQMGVEKRADACLIRGAGWR